MATKYAYSNGGYADGDSATHHKECPPAEEKWKGAGNKHGEHVCRPVIVDGKGNRRPVVCYKPSGDGETFVVASETIEERFYTPPFTDQFTCSYPMRVEEEYIQSYIPTGVYEPRHERRHPPDYRYPVRVEEEYIQSYIPTGVYEPRHERRHPPDYRYPVRVEEEYKYVYGSPSAGRVKHEPKHGHRHPSRVEKYEHVYPVRMEYKKHSPPASPVHDRPYGEVQQPFTHQNEVSQAPVRRPVPLGGSNWRQPHNSFDNDCIEDDYRNPNNINRIVLTRIKSSINDDDSDGDGGDHCNKDGNKKPTITKSHYWGRAKHPEWAAPTNSSLTTATNDIGEAVEILKKFAISSSGPYVRCPPAAAAAPAPPPQPSAAAAPAQAPAPTPPKCTETIDSTEASRRYGHFRATRPASIVGPTIDSTTAKDKYGGERV